MSSFKTLFSTLSFLGMLTGIMAAPTFTSQLQQALTPSMQNFCNDLSLPGSISSTVNYFPIFLDNLPIANNITCYGATEGVKCYVIVDNNGTQFAGSISYYISEGITITDFSTNVSDGNSSAPMYIGALDALVKLIIYESIFCTQITTGTVMILTPSGTPVDIAAFLANDFEITSAYGGLISMRLGNAAFTPKQFSFYESMSSEVTYPFTPLISN